MEKYYIVVVGNKQFCLKKQVFDLLITGSLVLLRLYKLPITTSGIPLKIIAKVNCKLNPQKKNDE